jgi:hypothetical protein
MKVLVKLSTIGEPGHYVLGHKLTTSGSSIRNWAIREYGIDLLEYTHDKSISKI